MTITGTRWPSAARAELGSWIRGRFVEINSALEDLYWDSADRNSTEPGQGLQAELLGSGEKLIANLANDDLTGGDFDDRFSLLGDIGMFISAVRRHEVERDDGGPAEQSPLAASVAIQLGASLGTAPRFLTAHNQTHNLAVDGRYRTFTSGASERLFTDYNTRSVYAYMAAADALVRAVPLGVSHPVTHDLLIAAADALGKAVELNRELSERLDVDEFFFRVRPYLKPCQIGRTVFRGNNAGDFAAFNEIDTIVGLCSMSDPHYAQIVTEKMPYLVPSERERLEESLRSSSLLDGFVREFDAADQSWFQKNAAAFLAVIDVLGEGARHHHDDIVERFITVPTAAVGEQHKERITASGPPLEVLISSLERLRDQRSAEQSDDVPTRYEDVKNLRSLVRRD
jgi:hypothetical protein